MRTIGCSELLGSVKDFLAVTNVGVRSVFDEQCGANDDGTDLDALPLPSSIEELVSHARRLQRGSALLCRSYRLPSPVSFTVTGRHDVSHCHEQTDSVGGFSEKFTPDLLPCSSPNPAPSRRGSVSQDSSTDAAKGSLLALSKLRPDSGATFTTYWRGGLTGKGKDRSSLPPLHALPRSAASTPRPLSGQCPPAEPSRVRCMELHSLTDRVPTSFGVATPLPIADRDGCPQSHASTPRRVTPTEVRWSAHRQECLLFIEQLTHVADSFTCDIPVAVRRHLLDATLYAMSAAVCRVETLTFQATGSAVHGEAGTFDPRNESTVLCRAAIFLFVHYPLLQSPLRFFRLHPSHRNRIVAVTEWLLSTPGDSLKCLGCVFLLLLGADGSFDNDIGHRRPVEAVDRRDAATLAKGEAVWQSFYRVAEVFDRARRLYGDADDTEAVLSEVMKIRERFNRHRCTADSVDVDTILASLCRPGDPGAAGQHAAALETVAYALLCTFFVHHPHVFVQLAAQERRWRDELVRRQETFYADVAELFSATAVRIRTDERFASARRGLVTDEIFLRKEVVESCSAEWDLLELLWSSVRTMEAEYDALAAVEHWSASASQDVNAFVGRWLRRRATPLPSSRCQCFGTQPSTLRGKSTPTRLSDELPPMVSALPLVVAPPQKSDPKVTFPRLQAYRERQLSAGPAAQLLGHGAAGLSARSVSEDGQSLGTAGLLV